MHGILTKTAEVFLEEMNGSEDAKNKFLPRKVKKPQTNDKPTMLP